MTVPLQNQSTRYWINVDEIETLSNKIKRCKPSYKNMHMLLENTRDFIVESKKPKTLSAASVKPLVAFDILNHF